MLCKSFRWRLSHQVAGFKLTLTTRPKHSLFSRTKDCFSGLFILWCFERAGSTWKISQLLLSFRWMCASYGLTVGCNSLSQMYRNPVPWSRLILNQVLAVKVHTAQLSQKLTSKVWGVSTNVAVMDVMGVVTALTVPCQLFRPALSGKRQVQV